MARRRTTSTNPWLPEQAPPAAHEPLEHDELLGERIAVPGPPVPLDLPVASLPLATPELATAHRTAPDQHAPDSLDETLATLPAGLLPAKAFADPSRLYVVGLHGGSGATTVTRLLTRSLGAAAATTGTPAPDTQATDTHSARPYGPGGSPRHALFVARCNGAGLAAAGQWAAGLLTGTRLVGLVLVADTPTMSRQLRATAASVMGLTPRCWRIGWRPDWHDTALADLSHLSLRTRRVVADIHRAHGHSRANALTAER